LKTKIKIKFDNHEEIMTYNFPHARLIMEKLRMKEWRLVELTDEEEALIHQRAAEKKAKVKKFKEEIESKFLDAKGHLDFSKGWFRYDTFPQRITTCILEYNGDVYIGMAFCSPKDVYSKEKGKQIAFYQALHEIFKNNPFDVIGYTDPKKEKSDWLHLMVDNILGWASR
jgi:hypothetical protein